jgi:hypothetical protein
MNNIIYWIIKPFLWFLDYCIPKKIQYWISCKWFLVGPFKQDFGDPSKMLPKSKEADIDMKAYRKRYCDWIQSLSPEEYKCILLWSIK